MARIAGVNIPQNKLVQVGLTYIYGIGDKFSSQICQALEIPKNKRYYLTIDIDAFDPSIASGTGTPSHGGFYYYEVLELVDGIIKQGSVVGLDLVEVAPDYDATVSYTHLTLPTKA